MKVRLRTANHHDVQGEWHGEVHTVYLYGDAVGWIGTLPGIQASPPSPLILMCGPVFMKAASLSGD